MITKASIDNSVCFGSFYDKFYKSLPNKELKNAAKYNKTGQALASPHWNRLALGAAAITTQPLIDYYNPNVDRDTATTSALRTIAKICACTFVGFCVRGCSYKLVEKFAHGSAKEGSTLLTPLEILKEKNTEVKKSKLKLHKNTLSTVTALVVMLFTNFLLDAPLTTKGANTLINLHKKYKASQESEAA
ncbi:hypothetical protein IJ750_02060 [bacterium]|nr:hypothetical protein [bacterium]MBR1775845.1 hypothetical protein [bacterium]